jgi:hypothetical protein
MPSTPAATGSLLSDSSALVSTPDRLRRRLEEDGYVYLPELIPASVLTPLRRDLMEVAGAAGWLAPGASFEHPLADPSAACGPPQLAFMEVHARMFGLERLHRFPHLPFFGELYSLFIDDRPLLHPQIRIRLRFPQFECTTPAHQDHFVIRGTPETLTVWVPLTDCPVEMGGLQILPGSHRLGLLPARQDPNAGTLELTAPLPQGWLSGDYRSGDVLVFHSLTVHRALPNVSDRLRASIDFRFQRLSDPIDPERFVPPHGLSSWDEIYAGWESGEVRHYWRSLELNCSPSTAALRRIAALPEHPDCAAAKELLRHL